VSTLHIFNQKIIKIKKADLNQKSGLNQKNPISLIFSEKA